MRDLKLTYLDKVQNETNKFLSERIKHDFMRPDRELSLDLTIAEAELLATANEAIRAQAESGALKQVHERFSAAQSKASQGYFAVREQLAKVLQVVEAKENEVYDRLISEFGLSGVTKHGQSSLFDVLGFSSGDQSFNNISQVEAAIANGHEAADQLRTIHGHLHAYQGVKQHLFAVEAELKGAYAKHVANGEEDELAAGEALAFAEARDRYQRNFSRGEVADFARNEYQELVASVS